MPRPRRTPEVPSPTSNEPAERIARLPGSNAITAVLIVIAALLSAVAILVVAPEEGASVPTAGMIAASGLALAGRVAIPRYRDRGDTR